MNIKYRKDRIKGFLRKYRGLSRLTWDEFRIGGWGGVVFAVRRHFKKRKGTLPVIYPTIDDYEKNLVTIAILTKNHLDLIKPCLKSIQNSLSQKYKVEILVGDTGSSEKEVWKFYQSAKKKWKNIKIAKIGKYFFSKNYNDLIGCYANGQYLILLNNDTIARGEWIDELVNPLEDKGVGLAGGKLLYKNETIQHAGMEFRGENALAVYAKKKKDIPEASFKAVVPVVTFACVAMRHDVFNRFRLNENYREEAQDTDFCLRLGKAGFKILYNPKAEIYHLECSSRDWRKGESDRIKLKKEWGKKIQEIISDNKQRVKFDPDEHKNSITVIRDDGIGDLLMGVSAFQKLREKYPEKKLILATYERNIEMMAGFGIFNEFIPVPDRQKYSPLPIPSDSKVFNLVDLEMDFKPFIGAPREDNKVNRHFTFTKIFGLDSGFKMVPMPDYPEARKKIEDLFLKLGISINQKFVVLNLVSANPARSWWEPYYPELIKAVEGMGFVPIITGTKDSYYFKGRKVINLIGKTKTIPEYIEAVKLGRYVISTDTSAYHVAALAGIPFLAIFTGGMTPESRLNLYEKYEVCAPPKSLECYPCWDEGCKDLAVRWKKDPCRLVIKPEEVIKKFKRLVERYP